MSFRLIFIAVFIATALVVAALILNARRPESETAQPTSALVKATGKCAQCHLRESASLVHQFERSVHAKEGVTCLDCHKVLEGQEALEHRDFVITTEATSLNCRECHATEYEQFVRSRHGAPAWAAVRGRDDFTSEQISFSEEFHQGAVDRAPNKLVLLEEPGAMETGCLACHNIGKPNADGSIGSCTQCHSRHSASIALARHPQTCGQCHMGPDHAQIEIYNESKHGVLFNAQSATMNLDAPPKELTALDMPIPTCATCHMSGLEGMKVTHDVTERLSFWLFAPISKKRPTYARGQTEMKEMCLKCHSGTDIDEFYRKAEEVVAATNDKVASVLKIVEELREEGLLTPEPFDESIEFLAFDYWHYFGRTAKHGAFMGGADFVQWHGNYELLSKKVEMEEIAKGLRGHR